MQRFGRRPAAVLLPLLSLAGPLGCAETGPEPVAAIASPLCGTQLATGTREVQRDGARLFARGVLGCADPADPVPAAIAALRAMRSPDAVTAVRAVADGEIDLQLARTDRDALGFRQLRFEQTVLGLPVAAGNLVVNVRDDSGAIVAISGTEARPTERPEDARVDGRAAILQALAQRGISGTLVEEPALGYLATGEGGTPLTWSALVRYQSDEGPELDRVFASAVTGDFVARHPQIHRVLNRRVHTANNGQTLPGTLLFQEGGTSADAAAKAAYDNAGIVYNFYKAAFNRDSFDGAGGVIISTVHFDQQYNNAFWEGSQMVYGDGDGQTFKSLALGFDVVAHELTHAVTQYSANLVYQNESGALNEAMSDIMGTAAEITRDKGVISANSWLLGEDIFTPNQPGDALRYMDNPTKDGISPDNYAERYTGTQDNGGVHINSGLANLAFNRLVVGGTHPRGKTPYIVPQLGVAKAQAIFYRALTTYMTANTNFAGARTATVMAAKDLYGDAEASAVHYAWDLVGVPGTPTRSPVSLEIESPQNGATVSGAPTVTTRLAQGSAYDIERAELFVGGSKAGECTTTPCTFGPAGLPTSGSVTAEVRTFDRSGKTLTSTPVTFTVTAGGGNPGGGNDPGGGDPDDNGNNPDEPGGGNVVGQPPGFCAVAVGGPGHGAGWLAGALALGLVALGARRRQR